jgi:hypothetical protein
MNVCVAAIDEPTFVGKSRKLNAAIAKRITSIMSQDSAYVLGPFSHISYRTCVDSDLPNPMYTNQSTSELRNQSVNEMGQLTELYFILGFDTITRLFEPRFYGSKDAMITALNGFFATPSPLLSPRISNEKQMGNERHAGDGSYVVCARRRLKGADTDEGEETHFLSSPEVTPYYQSGKINLMDLGEEVEAEAGQEGQALDTISSTQARDAFTRLGAHQRDIDAGQDGEGRRELNKIIPSQIIEYVLANKLYRST